MRASIYSVYLSNIPEEVRAAQASCVNSMLPKGWSFEQLLSSTSHPDGLHGALKRSENDITIFLDIDCIPLCYRALEILAEQAGNGYLAGAVQRANHIVNNCHLYVGPFCMAFSKEKYERLGSPPFIETSRGDVGEELSYKWHMDELFFMWPTFSEQQKWDLNYGMKFGPGTTYGVPTNRNLFYHAFNARDAVMQKRFVGKCSAVLSAQVFVPTEEYSL